MSITLYQLEGCPYCERVAGTLDALDVAFDGVRVARLHSERDRVRELSGQRTVPVLVDTTSGVIISESARIIEYLHTSYGDGDESVSIDATR